uniref:Candidate secreted effector n=1 Tax=Meloidogyne incognita TaxID=6306 RepID=A0A914MRE5_MELIC
MKNLVLSISKNPFKLSFRGSLNCILNSLLSCWLLQTSSQINNRNVWRRYTESHSIFCVAVTACTVVIKPSIMPNSSLITFARGARQLVVQEALL